MTTKRDQMPGVGHFNDRIISQANVHAAAKHERDLHGGLGTKKNPSSKLMSLFTACDLPELFLRCSTHESGHAFHSLSHGLRLDRVIVGPPDQLLDFH